MKKLLLLVAIAALGSMPLHAKQPGKHSPPDISNIVEQLELDANQAQRLHELVQNHHQTMRGMLDQKRILRSEFREMRKQHREELLGVLSHEQLYEFEKLMHEQRKVRPKHRQSVE